MMTAILPRKWFVGKSMVLLSAVLQGNASSQYPSTRSLQGKRSEDRIVCKIGFVESFNFDPKEIPGLPSRVQVRISSHGLAHSRQIVKL